MFQRIRALSYLVEYPELPLCHVYGTEFFRRFRDAAVDPKLWVFLSPLTSKGEDLLDNFRACLTLKALASCFEQVGFLDPIRPRSVGPKEARLLLEGWERVINDICNKSELEWTLAHSIEVARRYPKLHDVTGCEISAINACIQHLANAGK